MEKRQGKAFIVCFAENRLAGETSNRPHKVLERKCWADVVFAFHDNDEIGPKMLARMAKVTGLQPEDL